MTTVHETVDSESRWIVTFVLVVHLVLCFSGVERSPQCFPLQHRLTVLLYVLHIETTEDYNRNTTGCLCQSADRFGDAVIESNHVSLPSPAPGLVCSSASSSDRKAQRHESECPSEFLLSEQSRPSSLWSGRDKDLQMKLSLGWNEYSWIDYNYCMFHSLLPSLHVWGTAVCVWPGLQSVYHPAGTWGFLPASGDRWGGCPAPRRDHPARHKTEKGLTLWITLTLCFCHFPWFVVLLLQVNSLVHIVSFRLVCDKRSSVSTGCFILKIGQMVFVFPDFVSSSIYSVQQILFLIFTDWFRKKTHEKGHWEVVWNVIQIVVPSVVGVTRC